MKKIFSILISLTLILASFSSVKAAGPEYLGSHQSINFYSNDIPKVVTDYAKKIMPDYLKMASQDGMAENNISKYSIGEGISSYDYKNNDFINSDLYYFPILHNNKIEFVLAVGLNADGTCSATFGKLFADKLNNLKLQNTGNSKYALVSTNNKLVAVGSNNNIVLENTDNTKNDEVNKIKLAKSFNSSSKTHDIAKANSVISGSSSIMKSVSFAVSGPQYATGYSNGLGVTIVPQGNHPYCWAASIAAMINYVENRSPKMTAENVCYAVNNYAGANLSVIAKAWQYYGYSGTCYLPFSDGQIINFIDGNTPVQFLGITSDGVNGHSVVICGYGISVSAGTTYRIADSNYSSYTYSSTGQTPENTYITSGGLKFYYKYSFLPS